MYPYKIIWTDEQLIELYENESFGYVDNLSEIEKIIYKYLDAFIVEYKREINSEIKNYGHMELKKFYCIVNSEPYNDVIFMNVKYFDISLKTWIDYKINEDELNKHYLFRLKNFNLDQCEYSNFYQ